MKTAANPVKSVRTAVRIVEILGERSYAGVTELAEELSVAKSTVHNHLATLEEAGYVTKHEEGYALGSRLLSVAEMVRDRFEVCRYGRSRVNDVAAMTGEVVRLVVLDGDSAVIVFQSADDPAVLDRREGDELPLHATAAGKAILSQLSTERVETMFEESDLEPMTENTVTTFEELRAVARRVKSEGVAFDREEFALGQQAVAAPIEDADGPPSAICVAGPTSSMSGKRLEEDVTGLIISTAKEIEVELASN